MYRRPFLQRTAPSSVVVFRALQLGDMLCAVPALRALRNALPRAHIALVGLPWAQQFVERFPGYLDEFIPFPGHPLLPEQPVRHEALASFYAGMCARQFALAIQLHGSGDVSNDIVSGFGADAMAGFCRRSVPGRPRLAPSAFQNEQIHAKSISRHPKIYSEHASFVAFRHYVRQILPVRLSLHPPAIQPSIVTQAGAARMAGAVNHNESTRSKWGSP